MTTLLADLGGTRLKAGLTPHDVTSVAHGGDWVGALRAAVVASGADEVALAVPGVVDRGRVVSLPGKLPGLQGADLPALLGIPVALVVNDAIAYGVGESVGTPGRVVVVTLGTGVGVAVLEDGRPLGRGPLGGGLLGGQLRLSDGASFEAHCGAPASETCRPWLVEGLTALALAHAPDVLVVGGGAATPSLLDGVEEEVVAGLWPGQSVSVRLAALGDAAALHGLQVLLSERVPA